MSRKTEWYRKSIHLLVALTMALGLVMMPAAASGNNPVVSAAVTSGVPVSGLCTVEVIAFETDVGQSLTNVELDVWRTTPVDPYALTPGIWNINLVPDVTAPFPSTGAYANDMALANEVGFVSCTYDGNSKWTLVFNSQEIAEIGDVILTGIGYWPGMEVWFDGQYIFNAEAFDNNGEKGSFTTQPVVFDNEEEMTPELGLDAKGSQQTFIANWIDYVGGQPITGWIWTFTPGVNLDTVGVLGTSSDVIVKSGGKPGLGDDPDGGGPLQSTPSHPQDLGKAGPDRYITIWSRAPELGDCEVKMLAFLGGADGEPSREPIEVASGEKKWGELWHSELDLDASTTVLDQEVWENPAAYPKPCVLRNELSESVWCKFTRLPIPELAGGALVNWYIMQDSVENEEWIRSIMLDIAGRAGSEGSYSEWTARGKYDPVNHPAAEIKEYINENQLWPANTRFEGFSDPFVDGDDWWGINETQNHMPGEEAGKAYATLYNKNKEDVLVITLVEYQENYNGENLVLIQIGKKHFRQSAPRLAVTMATSDSPDPVTVGDMLTYTIIYQNKGSIIAHDVSVTDYLPPGVRFDSAIPAPDSVLESTLTWNIGDLTMEDGQQTITIEVILNDDIPNGKIFWNVASIYYDQNLVRSARSNTIAIVPSLISVEDSLASIFDYLTSAYGYQSGEGIEGWTSYNPDWPAERNTLSILSVGRGYWINVTQACTLQYGGNAYELSAGWNLIGWQG
ncbi:DUF11 domain-containing protein [Chloroflexota bacterium]